MAPAISHLGRLVERFNMRCLNDLSTVDHDFDRIVSRLSLADLNRALFHCEEEERDEGHGFGAYNIPGFGSTVYCGLQGNPTPISLKQSLEFLKNLQDLFPC